MSPSTKLYGIYLPVIGCLLALLWAVLTDRWYR